MSARVLKRFFHDERGAFAVMFGVMAIVMVALGGAAVDYISVDNARNQAQIALDSAALALQPKIYSLSVSDLKTQAEALLKERLVNDNVTVAMTDNDVSVDKENGVLKLTADITVPTSFVALVGIPSMTVQMLSQVTRKMLKLEVAFVLDNSGSMGSYSRMTNLKSAANCATNILFYDTCTPDGSQTANDKTKIAVVPFNFFVNIGSGNASASWMDTAGNSIIANDNFDNDDDDSTPYTGPVNRIGLYDGMYNTPWAGCVEARPYPYSVNDTAPDPNTPNTLFVPEFAPDEPDSGNYSNNYISDTGGTCDPDPTWVWTQTKSNCDKRANGSHNYDNATCYGATTDSYVLTRSDGTTETVSTAPATVDKWANPTSSDSYSYTGSYPNYENRRVRTYTYHLSDREYQERMCKYANASPGYLSSSKGPNAGCPTTSLLPLTNDIAAIKSRISAMVADGATNIHQGVIWGFRALSPTAPFTEGGPYDQATSKVMIVMTDGENTYYDSSNMNGTSYYSPFGYLWDSTPTSPRVGAYGTNTYADISDNAASMETKTDTLTLEACTNAKSAGIRIYTIGLDPPNTATRTMLTSCATNASQAYFPTDPSELNTVFTSIAEQLAQLRVEK